MGGTESKVETPNASIINEIKVNVEISTLYLIIIISILAIQMLATLYQLQKISLRKNYIRNVSMTSTKFRKGKIMIMT